MEEYEDQADRFRDERDRARADLSIAQARIEELETLNKSIKESSAKKSASKWGDNEADQEEKKELTDKIKAQTELIQEKEKLLSQKMEDNFNLKEMLEKQRQELTKLKQRNESLQDRVDNKELQCSQLQEDIQSLEKRLKLFNQSNMNSEDAQKRANQAKQ